MASGKVGKGGGMKHERDERVHGSCGCFGSPTVSWRDFAFLALNHKNSLSLSLCNPQPPSPQGSALPQPDRRAAP